MMKSLNINIYALIITLTICANSCSTEDSDNISTPSVLQEFVGSWQNVAVPTNWWVITETSIVNYGWFDPEPCGRGETTILSETTFTFDHGTGAGEQVTMQIINNQLVMTAPGITAIHARINNSDIPSNCTSL